MNAVAMTDHGNLCRAVEFSRECTDGRASTRSSATRPTSPRPTAHATATPAAAATPIPPHPASPQRHRLSKNLIKLASAAFLEGFHHIPRIDKELLAAHHEGIVCLSGCASGEFSEYILKEQMDEATNVAEWFHGLFKDNFYVEIQNNGLDIQKRCAEGAIDIAAHLGLPLVATCDAH